MENKTPGIIEGFYGHEYQEDARLIFLKHAKTLGFGQYIYAPKGALNLRGHYLKGLDENDFLKLEKISAHCQNLKISFGLGVSPVNLTLTYKENLEHFIELCSLYVERLKLNILAILFDDLKLDDPTLGKTQALIVNRVQEALSHTRIIFCPTYYSFDPILEKLFGKCPKTYFQDLKENLDPKIGIFWTGNKILSKSIRNEDLIKITKLLGKAPVIWDNYPVNDGKIISKYLHLKPFSGRASLDPKNYQGYFANPMNEAALSLLPLSTLPPLLAQKKPNEIKERYLKVAKKILGPKGLEVLALYPKLCNELSLDEISADDKNKILDLIKDDLDKYPALNELKLFLEGYFAFDPKCLTDI